MTSTGGLSRRNIIQGAAWATPVVLLASAAPALAVSGTNTKGAISLLDTDGVYNEKHFTLRTQVTYSGSITPPEPPVSAVSVEFTLPTSRLGTGVPTIVRGTGWVYVGATVSGSNTIFAFSWTGGALSSTAMTTTALEVAIPKDSSTSSTAVTVLGRGISNGYAVTTSANPAPITVTLASNAPAFKHGQAVRFEEWFKSDPKVSAWVVNGALAWLGPYWPVGPDVTSATVEIRVPQADSDGTVLASGTGLGAGWAANGAPAVVGGFWRFRYTYSGILGDLNRSTTELQFAINVTNPAAATAAYTVAGVSGGAILATSGTASR